jgi:Rrf2 family protein
MISRSGRHAVRALVLLAELPEGAYAGANAIAGRTGAPRNYLGKILQMLTRLGILVSQKGLRGGFRLARSPGEITLLDIVEPIEQMGRWDGCILGRGTCSEEDPCSIHGSWSAVKEGYLALLTRTTLADLVADNMLNGSVPQRQHGKGPKKKQTLRTEGRKK